MVLLCDKGGFVSDGDGAIRLMGLIGEEWSEKTKMQQRVGCMVASMKDINVSAVVCLGYPFKGSKDGLYPLEKLEATRKKMKAPN
ncbi:hypothetical protein HKD37_01G001454 [Glycine soja]|nr:hypothetical protein JHK86_001285 [Glycine max]